MNKKGLQFKLAFFALIAVSMMIIATGVLIGEWNDSYESGLDYDLEDFNSLDDVTDDVRDQEKGLAVKSTSTGDDFEGTSIRGVFGILNKIRNSFRIVFGDGGMLNAIADRFKVPNYIIQSIMLIMSVAITFALVVIFFRLGRRNV